MANTISATGQAGITQASAGAAAPNTPATPLDRQAFLKLLVAQIQHQDPLQPMQGTEYVSQLSQFAMIEQATSQTSALGSLQQQLTGMSNNEATSLVGRTVTVRGKTMAFDGLTATTSAATLGGPAQKVTASIVDASGNVVRTMPMGARAAGPLSVTWDGHDDSGAMAPKGSYTLRVNATDANGAPVQVTQDVSGNVVKVNFDKGYPELMLDSGAAAAISDIVSVAAAAASAPAR